LNAEFVEVYNIAKEKIQTALMKNVKREKVCRVLNNTILKMYVTRRAKR
jgi:hypothetical protein